jgi:hypothetical protein
VGKPSLLALILVTIVAPALALSSPVALRDVPGSNNQWQEGSVVVPAAPADVQGWMTDYARWKGRFPDIDWSQSLGKDDRGRNIVRFRSNIAGRTFTIHEAVKPGQLVFEGWSPNVYTQGRIWFIPVAGGSATRVVMQTTSQVHGFIGVFATRGLQRKHGFAAIRSQLTSLLDLARTR